MKLNDSQENLDIEDANDLDDWKEAKAEFDKDPVTYTAAEIAEKYL